MLKFLIFMLFTAFTLSQSVSEKFITEAKLMPNSWYNYDRDYYALRPDFAYDWLTGSYAYSERSRTDGSSRVVTHYGKSDYFLQVSLDGALFDKNGNIYFEASNPEDQLGIKSFLLKNNKIIYYGNIFRLSSVNDSTIKIYIDEGGGIFLIDLNHITGKSLEINQPGYFKEIKSPDGKKSCLVKVCNDDSAGSSLRTESTGLKYYNSIFTKSVKFDKTGEITYAAFDDGYLIVQGNKEYNRFEWIEIPILIDNNNIPVYVAGNINSSQLMLMRGNDTIGTDYYSRITDVRISPSGKIGFIGENKPGKEENISSLVIDGTVIRKARNIENLSFTDGDEPVFIESPGNMEYIVKGNSQISKPEKNILYYKYVNGKLFYFSAATDDESRNIFHFYIDGKEKCNYHKYEYFFKMPNDCHWMMYGADIQYWYKEPDIRIPPVYEIDSLGNCIYLTGCGDDLTSNRYIKEKIYCCFNDKISGPFFQVFHFLIYKSRPVFIGCTGRNSKMRIYADMKPVTGVYDEIFYYTFDKKTGLIRCLGKNGNKIYSIEVIL